MHESWDRVGKSLHQISARKIGRRLKHALSQEEALVLCHWHFGTSPSICLTLPKKRPHTWARDCTVLVCILSRDPLLPLGRASPWFSGSRSQCSPRTARVLCHSSCPHTITWSQLSTPPASTCGRACSSTGTHALEQSVF